MAQFTKKAITESFIRLLSESPLDKITVKDITDDCGINRNTFYFYFQDIYALLEEIFKNELENALAPIDPNDFESWQTAFLNGANFVLNNRKAMYHIYNSSCRDTIEKYISKVTGSIMLANVKKQARGLNVSPDDIKMVSDFYKFALIGLVFSWFDNALRDDPEQYIIRMGQLLEGNIRHTLAKADPRYSVDPNFYKSI